MFPGDTRILLVDDMTMMRTLLKTLLRGLGMSTFHEAQNGAEAFALLKKQQESKAPIQLVLADWNMPNVTGIQLLEQVRAAPEFKSLPFILVTAEGEADQVREAITLGVTNFIRKPFSAAIVKEKLEATWLNLSKAA